MKKYIMIAAGALLMQHAQAQITIDRTKQPKPGPAPVLTLKDPVTYKLPNGITLLVVEDHRLPKVNATYVIDAGPTQEGAKAGEVGLMGAMLGEGTKTMTKAEFDNSVEKLGATVAVYSAGGRASALTRYFANAFTLMGQALTEPNFTQESLDKLKATRITDLKADANSAAAIAGRVDAALVYGKTNPLGEYETEETINSVTLQDIKDTYAKYVSPSRGYLTIIGDITPAKAKELATQVLGNWKGAPITWAKIPEVQNPTKTEIDVVNVPSAVQSEIHVINVVDNMQRSNPDYFAVILANYILGGGAESRLFMNLREKHGFTYGAYANVGFEKYQNTFDASGSVRNAKVDSAVTEFLSEIKRIRTDKVTDEELNTAKALYNGSFALSLEDPARAATLASNILIYSLPADFYKTYLQKVNAITADDILRVAKKYFNYDNTRVIIVGNSDNFLDGLKKSGYTVKMYDDYANPIADAVKK